MKRIAAVILSSILLAGIAACDRNRDEPIGPATTSEAHVMSPEELGRLGAEIHASPERADELLSEHGMTEEQLEEQIRRVAADAEASRQYRTAYEEAQQNTGEASTES